ncbi:MAG: CHC2 zinc finger domain-containing protein [bacterium]|nr:CHC2 zinc finger domain-containing protein [bacterium]
MSSSSEKGEWMLREIAELALSEPIGALEVIGPPARYLDGTYLRVACDLLEMAARRLRDGTFDLQAFSCVVDDAARHVRLSRRTVETLWAGVSLPHSSSRRRSRGPQPLARFRPYLAEVAGRYTRLRRVGTRSIGRCPFHEDAKPSFVCYPDGRFFCFGCLQWGDAVDLVSRKEGLSIPQAATRLAEEFGDRRSAPPILRQGKKTPLPRPAGAQGESAHLHGR